jgi:hypothetical protein
MNYHVLLYISFKSVSSKYKFDYTLVFLTHCSFLTASYLKVPPLDDLCHNQADGAHHETVIMKVLGAVQDSVFLAHTKYYVAYLNY